jgi:biopolymer transport protein ExbB/TolQ
MRQDVEHRFGVRGGRFTSASSTFAFIIAAIITAAAYGAMMPFRDRYFVQMLTERGAVQYVTVFFSAWAIVLLVLKVQKIRLQRRAMTFRFVPADPSFVLSASTAAEVLGRVHEVCDDARPFILLNRLELALSNLKNMGRVSDLSDVLRAQAAHDEDVMESSYSLVRGLIWAIPVLGFIGTVQGLSAAVGNFGTVLASNAEVSALKPALRGVTAGLAVAFETTFVALVAALAIQLWLTLVKKSEEEMLDSFKEYCQRNLVSRLRL